MLLGQSGCGKTTTLRAIAGLETIDEGDILIDGKPVQHLKASDRDIALVFQSFSLYPHMTVYENIAFPLRATRMSQRRGRQPGARGRQACCRSPTCSTRKPSALSGGDMQRVAIGRALVRRPKAMLMDEPIGALDAKLREEMRAEIKRLHIKQGSTTIYVTHDQIEAMSLADRIVIMHEGVLQQVGTPGRGLCASGQPVRRAVRRQPGDERRRRHGRRGQAATASVTVDGAAEGFAFPARTARHSSNGQRRQGSLALGIRPEGVLVAREAAEGYPAGRGAHHRAARLLRHRRPQGRRRRCCAPAPERLRRRPATQVWARHRPGAGAFLRHGKRPVAGGADSDGPYPAQEHHQDVRQPHRAARTSTSRSPTASSSCCSARPAPARRRRCGSIAGLEKPTEGQVFIDGDDVADWGAAERDVALVLQQYSLYPRYTVRENLEFPLKSKIRRVADAEIDERVARVAKTLRIEHLLDRKTDRLSGGEMQRVSIGRAIVRKPRVFLMDEPLSALDAKLREALRTELKNLQMNLGATFLFVTHDQIEAMSMGDKIGVLNNGRLVQTGTPHEIYNNPRNTFVARSVGSPPMNLIDGKLVDGRAVMAPTSFELPYAARPTAAPTEGRAADLRHPPGGHRAGEPARRSRPRPRHREPRRREDPDAAGRRHACCAPPCRRTTDVAHRRAGALRAGTRSKVVLFDKASGISLRHSA